MNITIHHLNINIHFFLTSDLFILAHFLIEYDLIKVSEEKIKSQDAT